VYENNWLTYVNLTNIGGILGLGLGDGVK